MTAIHPTIDSLHLTPPGAYRERDILEHLRDVLPDGFEIFHSVDWSAIYQDHQRYGEVDIVVMSSLGHLALLEVKAGELTPSNDSRATMTQQAIQSRQPAAYWLKPPIGSRDSPLQW